MPVAIIIKSINCFSLLLSASPRPRHASIISTTEPLCQLIPILFLKKGSTNEPIVSAINKNNHQKNEIYGIGLSLPSIANERPINVNIKANIANNE